MSRFRFGALSTSLFVIIFLGFALRTWFVTSSYSHVRLGLCASCRTVFVSLVSLSTPVIVCVLLVESVRPLLVVMVVIIIRPTLIWCIRVGIAVHPSTSTTDIVCAIASRPFVPLVLLLTVALKIRVASRWMHDIIHSGGRVSTDMIIMVARSGHARSASTPPPIVTHARASTRVGCVGITRWTCLPPYESLSSLVLSASTRHFGHVEPPCSQVHGTDEKFVRVFDVVEFFSNIGDALVAEGGGEFVRM